MKIFFRDFSEHGMELHSHVEKETQVVLNSHSNTKSSYKNKNSVFYRRQNSELQPSPNPHS